MHLTRSHGLGHLRVPGMFSNLFFSYSGPFVILPVLAFSFHCDLGSVTGALDGQDRGKKVIQYFSLLHILGNQMSCSFLERAHIFPSLPFTTNVQFFLLPLMSLSRFHSLRPFLMPSSSDNISVFLPGYLLLLPPPVGFFSVFLFVQRLLVIHAGLLAFLPDFFIEMHHS